jgi:hypothetical protein
VISYKLLLANITTTKPTITNASSPPDFTRSSGEIQTNGDNSFITAGFLNKTGGFEKKNRTGGPPASITNRWQCGVGIHVQEYAKIYRATCVCQLLKRYVK